MPDWRPSDSAVTAYAQILELVFPTAPVNLVFIGKPEPGFLLCLKTQEELAQARAAFPPRVEGVPIYYRIVQPDRRLHAD